jgi:TPR repeat protein
MGEEGQRREGDEVRIGVLKTHGLATLLAGLACVSYVSGQETKAPVEESLESLRGRAEKGEADAQYKLAEKYLWGSFSMRPSHAEAVRWYRRAAEQGHPGGQFGLGFMYHQGAGVAQDSVEAYKWMSLAAMVPGNDQVIYAFTRDLVAKKMTSAQVAEAQRRAREWKPKTAQESKEPTRK